MSLSPRLYKRTLSDGATVEVHLAAADGVSRLTAVVRLKDAILKRLSVPAQGSAAADALSEQARDLAIDALRAVGR